MIGGAFVVLAVYLAAVSTYVLVTGHHAKHSPLGIGWTAATAAVMLGLAFGKDRVGRALGNPVLLTEGRVTFVDALLATAVLLGLVLNAVFGWWWADPVAGYVILLYAFKEGRAALGTLWVGFGARRRCNLFSQVIAFGNIPPREESDGLDLRAGEPQQPSP